MEVHTIIEDPGHAWLRVLRTDMLCLGLSFTDFSEYSKKDDLTVYLEEDCDMSVYVDRLILRGLVGSVSGFISNTVTRYTDADSFIRLLPSILENPEKKRSVLMRKPELRHIRAS